MRKFYGIVVLFSCLLLSGVLDAQTITGSVVDSKTGEPLIGATVVIVGKTTGTTVDVNGKFVLNNVGTFPLQLRVSYLGYLPFVYAVNSQEQKVKIVMVELETVLKVQEISDTRITEKQRENPLTVEALDIIAIKETPAANFYDGLGALKGVDLTAASLGFKIINTRGFNSTSPVRSLQIIDGVDNQAPGLNFSLGNFLGSSELDVQKVDIIVGASSAFYGPNAFNGVISMNTKSPFDFPGLSVQTKVGERELFETAIRWAQKFKNKDSVDKFAYKLNISFMKAYDWEADNMSPTEQSIADARNPGGYDAVNRYGDEAIGTFFNDYTSAFNKEFNSGLGAIFRNGYEERDLVDYNTRNLKLNAAFHYRIKPDVELIFSSNFGTGTTIYQGENRFSLRDILFFQNRLELVKKDKGFIRFYATHENAGNSYDAVVSAFELQGLSKSNETWVSQYFNSWKQGGFNAPYFKVQNFPGYPSAQFDEAIYDQVMIDNYDALLALHDKVRDKVNKKIYLNELDFFEPGTARFDSALASIKSRNLSEGGSKLKDKSALYHLHAEYKFKVNKKSDLTVGSNGRIYTPNSEGSIFSDTLQIDRIEGTDTTYKRRVIINREFGAYAGYQIRLIEDRLKLSATVRVDKNQNFDYISTQSVSAVYTVNNNHVFRAVFSSAIRNPTLQDQYLYYNVGRAILLGNLEGKDSLIRVESFRDYLINADKSKLRYFNVDPIRPERVRTLEAGYRATWFKKLFVDASYYYSVYRDFIGFKVGIDADFPTPIFPKVNAVYRLSSNTNDLVYTQGVSVGLNYYFANKYSLIGNYSYNRMSRPDSTDEIITAFNTPLNKFNIGFNGREIKLPFIRGENFSFSMNYKWIQGFRFEGAPQFTGSIPSYALVDAQVSWAVPKIKSVFKLGASNILNNRVFMVYGGPRVGRMAYFSILVDIPKN
jgi:outer membrane receptor protein involved in Fe transport